jgi:hypothetical protein
MKRLDNCHPQCPSKTTHAIKVVSLPPGTGELAVYVCVFAGGVRGQLGDVILVYAAALTYGASEDFLV